MKERIISGINVRANEIRSNLVLIEAIILCSPNISLTLINKKTAIITITLELAGLFTWGSNARMVNSSEAIAPNMPIVTIQSLVVLLGIIEVNINASMIEIMAYGIPRYAGRMLASKTNNSWYDMDKSRTINDAGFLGCFGSANIAIMSVRTELPARR